MSSSSISTRLRLCYPRRMASTPEMTAANLAHRFVDRITTPMLVIHGAKDYRVPIGEALRWYQLLAASGLPAAVVSVRRCKWVRT
jgi:dipeptidyl aminopeptidase/acylaminoacyl peptidase